MHVKLTDKNQQVPLYILGVGLQERIHIDFAGPFLGHMFFLVIDAYSKWLEILLMPTTTLNKTIETLKSLFARYGLLEQIVSDNGPQFTSDEFK